MITRTLIFFISLSAPLVSFAEDSAKVIVYGSTPGGFCAAIAAAREGASVILLEPTDHVGGVNTGGLSFSDSNQTVRSTVMGLFDEWHSRIEADYEKRGITLPYKVSVKDHTHWSYEPHVAARITNQMLNEAGVKVLTRRVLKSVSKDGATIKKLHTSDGDFTAKIFIDGSYEGDLMAAAGVSWTIGREGRKEFGESLAGKQYGTALPKSSKKKMPISGFDDTGKVLPLITTTDAGADDAGDASVMVYSFRLCLTANPQNRVPMPTPANYDPARFEVVRRHLQSGGGGVGFDTYPLPGDKFDGNNSIHGQFSLGLPGVCNAWCEASLEERKVIWEAHKQYTLEFYHFLTTDPAVPKAIRAKFAPLGLCKDEFPEYGHFSPALYVREGRRMKGMYVVTQKDIMQQPQKDDAIAVSSFPIDSHDCQRIALKDGGVVNEGTMLVRMKDRKHGYVYHIPYRSILPVANECENLLVPVALSCTHVAISSIRVEPTWMILGQSAGIAAALSAKENVAVQKLPYPMLRERLLAQKQVLEIPVLSAPPAPEPVPTTGTNSQLPSGIVLDDSDAEITGEWVHSRNLKPHIGSGYLYHDPASKGQFTALFRLNVPKSGEYSLLMAYSAHPTRSKQVQVTVVSGADTRELTVDQTQPLPQGQKFRPIGTVNLAADVETTIQIKDKRNIGFVILDALQLVPTR